MKRIYKNNDLVFSLKLDDTVKDFNLKFYTIKESNCIVKSNKDVVENKVILQWDELKNLEEGVMYYDYILYSPNLEMNDGKLDTVTKKMTNYYICSGIGELDDDTDLYNYYTKEQVDELIDNVVVGTIDLSNYYTKSQVDIKLGDYIEEDVLGSYYTKSEVNDLIDNIEIPTGGTNVDMSDYYTKTEVNNLIPTDYIKSIPSEYITESELSKSLSGYSKSSHTHNYLSSIPSEYITETELTAKGYLTEHQSLDYYYTKTEVDNKINNSGNFDSTQYYTKSEVDNKIPTDYLTSIPSEYITESELNTSLNGYSTTSHTHSEYITEQYDDTSIVNRISALETELNGVSELITELNGMIV